MRKETDAHLLLDRLALIPLGLGGLLGGALCQLGLLQLVCGVSGGGAGRFGLHRMQSVGAVEAAADLVLRAAPSSTAVHTGGQLRRASSLTLVLVVGHVRVLVAYGLGLDELLELLHERKTGWDEAGWVRDRNRKGV
jgi:hypothetical protein